MHIVQHCLRTQPGRGSCSASGKKGEQNGKDGYGAEHVSALKCNVLLDFYLFRVWLSRDYRHAVGIGSNLALLSRKTRKAPGEFPGLFCPTIGAA
jgi:hypothetical protein